MSNNIELFDEKYLILRIIISRKCDRGGELDGFKGYEGSLDLYLINFYQTILALL